MPLNIKEKRRTLSFSFSLLYNYYPIYSLSFKPFPSSSFVCGFLPSIFPSSFPPFLPPPSSLPPFFLCLPPPLSPASFVSLLPFSLLHSSLLHSPHLPFPAIRRKWKKYRYPGIVRNKKSSTFNSVFHRILDFKNGAGFLSWPLCFLLQPNISSPEFNQGHHHFIELFCFCGFRQVRICMRLIRALDIQRGRGGR